MKSDLIRWQQRIERTESKKGAVFQVKTRAPGRVVVAAD